MAFPFRSPVGKVQSVFGRDVLAAGHRSQGPDRPMRRDRTLWGPLGILICALSAAVPTLPRAEDFPPMTVQILAGPCASCHGPGGHSPGAIPSIAGLSQADAVEKMLAFRNDADPAATVMPRLMKGYDEDQIRALAHWFAEGDR